MLFGANVGLLAVAAVVAIIVTALELVTSKYPRTARFALTSPWFYFYVVIYGVLAAVALLLLPLVGDQVTVQGIATANPWVKAALIGFSVKAALHIRIFAVSTGPGQSFPVGLESFVQLFEPWMLRNLELDHFSTQSAFIAPRAQKFPDPDPTAQAKAKALANPPPALSNAEIAAFKADINAAEKPAQVIAAYLQYSGIVLTTSTFP